MGRPFWAASRECIRGDGEAGAGRRRLTRAGVVNGVVLGGIVIVVVVGVLVQRDRDVLAHPSFYGGPYAPVSFTAGGTVTMAQPGVVRPSLIIYEDFQCSVCQAFEEANGGILQRLAYQGKVRVVYQLFTIFLGVQPQQANSTRAWAAARCVPAGHWLRYHNLLYASQPDEITPGGFPVRQLLALGRRIGLVSRAFVRCVSSQEYAAGIVAVSERITRGGVSGTPTVMLNGSGVGVPALVSPGRAVGDAILTAR